MNIETIANKLNLSASTVSRALRDCNGVRPKTRELVLKKARKLGYRSPDKNKSHGVALLLPGNSTDEVHELAHRCMITIGDEVMKLGWQLYLVIIPQLDASILDLKETWPKTLMNNNIDCCIVVDMISTSARKLLAEHFLENVVTISRSYLEEGISGVAISDYSSGMFAAEKLLKRGHTNIGWIGSLGSEDISRKRFSGMVSKLYEHGLHLETEVWMNERIPLESDKVNSIMTSAISTDRMNWPTAWVASTDWLGAKVMLWLESQDFKCPKDVSMICFDDTKIAEALVQRKITSVVTPITKVAEGAVKLLLNRWNGQISEPVSWIYPVSYRKGVTLATNKLNR